MTALVASIRIQRPAPSTARTSSGQPIEHWQDVVTLRAAIVSARADYTGRPVGEIEAGAVVFRTRFVDGVTPADRVLFGGRAHRITAVTEIGRRKWLEISTTAPKGA